MKFGLESEKFLFNLRTGRPSKGVFSFLDAISEFPRDQLINSYSPKATNEFVLNMVEIGTDPSASPLEVLKEYLFHFLMIKMVAEREDVTLAPLSSLPMNYLPHMIPRWGYYVQNSILAGRKQSSWMMNDRSPLKFAGNCAGVHVHIEIETPPEFLFSNNELVNKFNLGLTLAPLIAFSSSPYFFGKHSAQSMRGLNYYGQVYKNFPLNGALPPLMASSMEVLNYFQKSIEHWLRRGVRVGFHEDELKRIVSKKGANWNPVRWNRQWNTIEIRCLESDFIDMDGSKFIWICTAFMRLVNEGLTCEILDGNKLDKKYINDLFHVCGGRLSIPCAKFLQDIFLRAIQNGLEDEFVEHYLYRLLSFVEIGVEDDHKWIFNRLKNSLETGFTTSSWLMFETGHKKRLSPTESRDIVLKSIERQAQIIKSLRRRVPQIFQSLEEMDPFFL
jgi:hypothetical protein